MFLISFFQLNPRRIKTVRADLPVSTLALKTAPGDSEVNEGDPGTEVGWEVHAGVPSRQEDVEGRREVDICVSDRDEHST